MGKKGSCNYVRSKNVVQTILQDQSTWRMAADFSDDVLATRLFPSSLTTVSPKDWSLFDQYLATSEYVPVGRCISLTDAISHVVKCSAEGRKIEIWRFSLPNCEGEGTEIKDVALGPDSEVMCGKDKGCGHALIQSIQGLGGPSDGSDATPFTASIYLGISEQCISVEPKGVFCADIEATVWGGSTMTVPAAVAATSVASSDGGLASIDLCTTFVDAKGTKHWICLFTDDEYTAMSTDANNAEMCHPIDPTDPDHSKHFQANGGTMPQQGLMVKGENEEIVTVERFLTDECNAGEGVPEANIDFAALTSVWSEATDNSELQRIASHEESQSGGSKGWDSVDSDIKWLGAGIIVLLVMILAVLAMFLFKKDPAKRRKDGRERAPSDWTDTEDPK